MNAIPIEENVSQQAANGALQILVSSSIRGDIRGALMGAKVLRYATEGQIVLAREYCRTSVHHSLAQIEHAISGDP